MGKKILSLLLSVCFVFSLFPITSSALVLPKIDGPETLYKPMDNSYTAVKYNVVDALTGDVINTPVTWSCISDDIILTDDGEVILHKDIPNGTYTINVSASGYNDSLDIQIKNGYFNQDSSNEYRFGDSTGAILDDFTIEFSVIATTVSGNGVFSFLTLNTSNTSAHDIPIYFNAAANNYTLRLLDYTTGSMVQCPVYTGIPYGTKLNVKIDVKHSEQNDYANFDVYIGSAGTPGNTFTIPSYTNLKSSVVAKGYTGAYRLMKYSSTKNNAILSTVKVYSGKTIDKTQAPYKYIISDDAVSGSSSFGLPRKGDPITSQYDIINIFGTSVKSDALWSVAPSGQGVTINSAGLLTIQSSAVGNRDYTITAAINGKSYTKTISISDSDYNMLISGSDGYTRDHTFTSKTFVFEVNDQFGTPADDVDWTFSDGSIPNGITLTNDSGKGRLTISSDASDGTYYIKAVASDGEGFDNPIAYKSFTLSSAEYSISGLDTVTLPTSGHNQIPYKLVSSVGNDATDGVIWAVNSAGLLDDGRIIVKNNTPSFKITAIYKGKEYSKNVTTISDSLASGTVYTGTINYTASHTMPLTSSKNTKNLTANITDGTSQIEWTLIGVSSDCSAVVGSDIYIDGSKLIVSGSYDGEVYISANIKNTDITTGSQTIEFVPAFTAFNSNVLTVSGTNGEAINIKHYKPKSGNYITNVLDHSADYFSSYDMTVPCSKDFSLELTEAGMHKISVVNSNGDINEYEVMVDDNKLFDQPDIKTLLTDAQINKYLSIYTDADNSLVNKCSSLYSGFTSSQKDKVLTATGKNINNYYASVLLVDFLRGNTADSTLLKNELLKLNLKTTWVAPVTADVKKSVICTDALNNLSGINGAFDAIVLSAVKNGSTTNTKEIKPYLALIGSSKYDNTDTNGKNAIALAVSGKTYATLSDLHTAINNVNITSGDASNTLNNGPASPAGNGNAGSNTQSVTIGGGVSAPSVSQPVQPSTRYYNDVTNEHWASDYITRLSDKGIVSGYGNNDFKPENSITRAEFVKLLVEAFNITKTSDVPFADTPASEWYTPYISGAYSSGLINGDGANFRPNEQISRQDASVMIYRFINYTGASLDNGNLNFIDSSDIADYAQNAISSLCASGILSGMPDGNFAPNGNTTRAQAAKLIYIAMEKGGIN